MLSIAELAHKQYPKAIAEMICQELQPLDMEKLDVAVDIIDSILEIQIRTDSAIDKEKLLTLVHSKLQNLHIESVAKFRIHCWRNDEESQEQQLLWTEQFMLDLPKSSRLLPPDIDPELDRHRSEMRSPEPQLSKHSVLQQAIKKIAPNNAQAKKQLLAADLDQQDFANGLTITANDLAKVNRSQTQSSDSDYWQLLFVGLSIVALGLGIGASVRAVTSKAAIESSSSSSLATPSVEKQEAKNTITTPKNIPIQTIQPSAATTQPTPKTNPASVEPIASLNEQEQEQVAIITLEKFNRIQKGMTIEQVEKVFGTSGKVIAENNSSNSIGQVYSWKNPQGSNAIIEFKDGQVVAKAQAGL